MGVITHDRFGGPDVLDRLRAQGIDIDTALTNDQLADMKLPEPKYGETTLGQCTTEEAALFHAMWQAQQALEDQSRILVGNHITKIGATIKDSDRSRPWHELMQTGGIDMAFDNDETAEQFFQLQQRVAMMHATFHWMIGERLGTHRDRLGIRSKLRIVSVARRY